FGAERFEKVEGSVFMGVTFHVEVDKRAQLARAAQDRPELRPEMRDRAGWIGRVHLRIERGNFYREIYDWKKLGVCSERIGPAACFAREMFEQFQAARGVCVGLCFTDHSFAQKIDGEPDVLLPPLA